MDLCQCTDSDRMVYGLGLLLGKSSGALTSGSVGSCQMVFAY